MNKTDNQWQPDFIGNDYQYRHIYFDNDYAGTVRCTVIRKMSREASKRAVIYVHGFSDYFFQTEMADTLCDNRYNFYAVDLRRYGRSLMPGQKMFEIRNLAEYFDDINAAVDIAASDGNTQMILMGHSTGGLTTALYMAASPRPQIKALVLNSPFLTWNLPALLRRVAIPAVAALGRLFPHMPVHQKPDPGYAQTMHRDLGGEWDYRRDWKPDILPDPDAAWIRAIDKAQRHLRHAQINVPVLLLHSARSAKHGDSIEKYATSDAILNVETMAAAGRRLGNNITEITVEGGKHDLILSAPDVRRLVLDTILQWLEQHNL